MFQPPCPTSSTFGTTTLRTRTVRNDGTITGAVIADLAASSKTATFGTIGVEPFSDNHFYPDYGDAEYKNSGVIGTPTYSYSATDGPSFDGATRAISDGILLTSGGTPLVSGWSALGTGTYGVSLQHSGTGFVMAAQALKFGFPSGAPMAVVNKAAAGAELASLRAHLSPHLAYDTQFEHLYNLRVRYVSGITPTGITSGGTDINFSAGLLSFAGQPISASALGSGDIRVVYSVNGLDSLGDPFVQRVINGVDNAYFGRCWRTGPNGRPVVSVFTGGTPAHTEIAANQFCCVHIIGGWPALAGSPVVVCSVGQAIYGTAGDARAGVEYEIANLRSNPLTGYAKLLYTLVINASGAVQTLTTPSGLWVDNTGRTV